MMPGMKRISWLAVAPAVLLAGCSASVGDDNLKVDQVKDTITKQYAAQGVKLSDLTCNDEIEGEKGAPIKCTALNQKGTKLYIEGEVTEIKDSKANFKVETVRATATGAKVAELASAALEKQVGRAPEKLTCPDEVPLPTTPTVTCELTDQGKVYDATVTITKSLDINVKVAETPKG